MKKEYTGSVYIGVVGPETEIAECRDTIDRILLRNGDQGPVYHRATKGYEARQLHLNKWINETRHDFLLLLDADMTFPPDTLERLRSHKLPFVSGFYMRRRYNPIAPVWFHLPPRGAWPMEPFSEVPERGKLYPLGASGWGCMLLHREVVEATRPLLKGEQEIAEDDMDIWPYDLPRLMGALRGIDALLKEKPSLSTLYPALQAHYDTLSREIRVLRGDHEIVGSDIRYPFFAREAGYMLMGDPEVRCGHMIDYPVHPDDWDNHPRELTAAMHNDFQRRVRRDRKRLKDQQKALVTA